MGDEAGLRLLGEDDLPAYKALRDHLLALHPEAFTSDALTERTMSAAGYRNRLGGQGDEAHFTLGAWRGARLVGAISCERDPRLKVRHIAHVVGMMLHPDARGRGLGRALLERCLELLRGVPDVELVTLNVTSTNAAAVALYRGAGFERYGRLLHAIKLGEIYHDKDLMVLTLRP
jgi:ribosomal protein S18 acetylase RimI-like enzyme